jgi:putative nucleotidyltransferase with HDIG domain
MDIKQLKTLTEKIPSLPTLPTVLTQMNQLLQDPHTSAEEVGKAIANDQSLASKVLKLVNSAFYGFPGKINTITHAIVILGFGTVKNIVLTASIFDSFGGKGDAGAFNVEDFWLHSIAVGTAAKVIAKQTGFRAHEECFLGGLMHDIGKIILNQYTKPEMAKILKHVSQNNCLFFEAEKKELGITHQEIGGWLANKWNLPKDLTCTIEYHHYPPAAAEHAHITSIVHLADILIRALDIGSGGDNKIPKLNEDAWKKLNFKEGDLQKLFFEIEQEVEKAAVFLTLN